MNPKTFEEFIEFTLDIVSDFVETTECKLVYGFPNEQQYPYIKTKSPLNDKLIYSIISPSQGIFYLRFVKTDNNHYQIFIDNGQISLTLDQDMKRLTNYPNEELNLRIDNIKGNTKEKLTTCLFILWDITCFIVFLSKENIK